ncbi:XRE family transcriptional regulator [Eubacterium limosum]|uniref:XRE family transcriptional regulator n=1 Tax=Eubacterium limosum TaxID=1736 RepID=UPI00371AD489
MNKEKNHGEEYVRFGKNLAAAREAIGLSQAEVSKALDIPQSTYAGYELGNRKVPLSLIIKFSEFYNIPAGDLIGIQDKPDLNIDSDLEKINHIYRLLSTQGKILFKESLDLILKYEHDYLQEQEKKSEKRIKIPTGTLVDFHEIKDIDDKEPCKLRPVKTTMQSLSAGCGSIGDDDQYTEINYPDEKVPDGTDFASKITGDSMEPTFFDGDIVFYELTQDLREGDIGVFKKNDENFIKEYRKNGLVSHNPAYEIIVPGIDDHIITIGKVLGKL